MIERIKRAFPRALLFSVVFTLIGIPLGHYHVEHMASEMLLNAVIAFIVYLLIDVFFTWLAEKGKRRNH